jgi:hypothetical protein
MRRGWEVELNDGTIMTEESSKWRDVPNAMIKRLTLHYEGRRWDLSGKQAYFVKNRASMVPGIARSFRIERRCIGYYEGAKKIHYMVEEATGKFSMHVEDNS